MKKNLKKYFIFWVVLSMVICSIELPTTEKIGAQVVVEKKDGSQVEGELVYIIESNLVLISNADAVTLNVNEISQVKVLHSGDNAETLVFKNTGLASLATMFAQLDSMARIPAIGGGDGVPRYLGVEGPEKTVVQKARKFPWLAILMGAAIGVAVYFVVIKKARYTLTVSIDAGCTGSPASTAIYKKGTKISYGYLIRAGFSNLQVKIDGVAVPSYGSVNMDRDKTITVTSGPIEMISIPGGTFVMGSNSSESYPAERPLHTVAISPFQIGKYEVTQEQWGSVMGSNPSHFYHSSGNYPVETVSWNECQTFILRLNQLTGRRYRLPTEAEWEYACRAGTSGDRYGDVYSIAWVSENSGNSSHPVGLKQPNAWGLYDTLGNVLEWCQDWYGHYSADPQVNPTGPSSGKGRCVRGSNWYWPAQYTRAPFRGSIDPTIKYNNLGLRLALD